MSDRFGHIPIQSPESPPPAKKPILKPSNAPFPAAAKARKGSPKKGLGLLAAVLVVIAGYAAFGFFGVPYYATKILPEKFRAKTGMVLEPATVTFNPFTFRFTAGELRILNESGTVLMSLHRFAAKVAPASFLRLSILCKTVDISGLDLKLAREADGSYNFQHTIGTDPDQPQVPVINYRELPFSFSLNNIAITDSRMTFNDAPAGKVHIVDRIQLELPTFSNIPFQTDQYLRPHFSAIVNGSPVELTGQSRMGEAGAQDQTTHLSLNLHDLDLTIYSGYLPFNLPLAFSKGTADGKIDLLFNPQNKNGDRLSVGFQMRISEAELSGDNGSTVIAVPTAKLNGNLQPFARRLHFTEAAFKDPTINFYGHGEQENGKTAERPPEAASAPAGKEAPAYDLGVDLLLVDNATLRLHPEKDHAQADSIWHGIQVSIKKYRSAGGTLNNQRSGSFSLSGEKDGSSSSFSWQGTFAAPKSVSGSLTLSKMDCDYLFQAVSSGHPLQLQGTADLRGLLTLSAADESSSPFRYELVDAEVSIEDFSLIENEKSILAAELVRLSPLHLVDNTLDLGNVQFQQGSAQFTYGRFPEALAALSAPRFRVQGIDFAGKMAFSRQENPDAPLVFHDVSLKANQLDSPEKASDNLSFSGTTATGGIVKAHGDIRCTPFSLAVTTGFRDLPAMHVWPLLTASPAIDKISAALSGQGVLALPDTSFTGELQLTDGSSKGPKETMVSWQRSVLRDVQYTAAPFHLGISAIEIDGGRFSWEIARDGNGPLDYFTDFIQQYLPSGEMPASADAQAGATPIDIKEISLTRGRIALHDRRLTPDWQGEITGLTGTITNIRSAAAREGALFSFAGKIDDAPFTIKGEVDLFSQTKNGTFHFSLENYPLASFYQQLESKTDLDASSGEFKLNLDGRWQDQLYINSGDLTLINLEPATNSDFAVPLALLTGTDSTVRLPFDFSRAEPVAESTLFDVLLASFQTKIIKGSVSPLLLAGEEFSNLVGNEFIEFQPGEFVISPAGGEVLGRYAALLAAHPQIGLALSGGINKEIDSQAMQEQLTSLEQQRVALENEKRLEQWQEKKALYQKKLEEQQNMTSPGQKIIEQDIPADILAGFSPLQPVPIVIDDAMLLELAQKRLNIVYQYFTAERDLQPDRISIVPPDILDGLSESPTSGVSITLKAINR